MIERSRNSQKSTPAFAPDDRERTEKKWREFVRSVVSENIDDSASVRGVRGEASNGVNASDRSRVRTCLQGATANGRSEDRTNVVLGPWEPATPEQVEEERRRVIEEPPGRWWWRPRYELAVLERSGMNRDAAVDQVRADHEAT